MFEGGKPAGRPDLRISIYRFTKHLLIIAVIGIAVKYLIFDSISVKGKQMMPSIANGDRILLYRLPYLPILKNILTPGLKSPVVFESLIDKQTRGCLRVAGISGDTVSIDSGRLVNSRKPRVNFRKTAIERVVPSTYSPRDFLQPYRIPHRYDVFKLDSLSERDFYFAVSVIRQENPDSNINVKTDLFLDDSISNDYIISDFSLYKGVIDSVPAKDRFDWFFWDRIEEYLRHTLPDKKIELKHTLYVNKKSMKQYIVKNRYAFLLADNWNDGLDSRYIGPVATNSIFGRAISVLCSFGTDEKGGKFFNIKRLGRLIR